MCDTERVPLSHLRNAADRIGKPDLHALYGALYNIAPVVRDDVLKAKPGYV